MRTTILITLVAFICISGNCKKDNTTPCVISVATVAGTYKITSIRYKPSGSATETEIINTLATCQRDDVSVLNANGTFAYQDAGLACTPSGNFAGDWVLTGTTAIDIEGRAGPIQSFDCTTLVFYQNNFPNAGDKTTYTYVKQ